VDNYGLPVTDNGSVRHAFPRPDVIAEIGVRDFKPSRSAGIRPSTSWILQMDRIGESGAGELADTVRQKNHRSSHRHSWSWLMDRQLALIRAFGRPDGFPVEDLALRRTLNDLLIKETTPLTPAHALQISKRWSRSGAMSPPTCSPHSDQVCSPSELGVLSPFHMPISHDWLRGSSHGPIPQHSKDKHAEELSSTEQNLLDRFSPCYSVFVRVYVECSS